MIGSLPEDASAEMAEYFLPSVAELGGREGGGSNRGGEGRGGNREQQSYPVGAVRRGAACAMATLAISLLAAVAPFVGPRSIMPHDLLPHLEFFWPVIKSYVHHARARRSKGGRQG